MDLKSRWSFVLVMLIVLGIPLSDVSARQTEESFLGFLNQKRDDAGLQPFLVDNIFDRAATKHADEMKRWKYFARQSPSGTRPIDRVRTRTDRFLGTVNLNIYRVTRRTPGEALRYVRHQWAEDRSLRRVVLDPANRRIGIGIGAGETDGTVYLAFYTGYRVLDRQAYRQRVRQKIHDRVNDFRESLDLSPIEHDGVFRRVAQGHAEDMVERGFFSHVNPDGQNPLDRMQAYKRGYVRRVLENLAYHTPAPPGRFADSVVEGWENSPGHRKNMVTGGVRWSGLGISFNYRRNLVYVAHKFGNRR